MKHYVLFLRLCNEDRIKNYTICDDLVVDVNGDVDIHAGQLEALLFQFGEVTGDFYCDHNNLTSLQYCPTAVGGDFYCSHNPFEVIPENYASWIKAIKVSPYVYPQIKHLATPMMTAYHKLLWEL